MTGHRVVYCTRSDVDGGGWWWELRCACDRWFMGPTGGDAVELYVAHLNERRTP